MKKLYTALFVLLCAIVAFSLSACTDNKSAREEFIPTEYSVNLAVKEDLSDAYLTEEINYVNATGTVLEELTFYIYPEAYREGAVDSAYFDSMKARNPRFGGIDIANVKVNGEEVGFSKEEIWLYVPLTTPLGEGEAVDIKLGARIIIPSGTLRFGGDGDIARLLNFYPILAVFSGGEWNKTNYSKIGDPFFSDSASYKLTVSTPKTVSIATSGKKISDEIIGETRTVKSESKSSRDCAVVLSKSYAEESKEVNGVTFRYFAREGKSELDFLIKAAEIYTEFFGGFPYEEMSVCESPFYYGGMEYPGLVVVNEALEGEDKKDVIVHELLHQWIGCAVGSDGVREPWVDESLVSYLTVYYHRLIGNESAYRAARTLQEKQFDAFYTTEKLTYPGYRPSINRNVYEFNTLYEYDAVVYKRGAAMYASINDLFGDKKFVKAVREYYERYNTLNATGEDLIASFQKSLGNKTRSVMYSYLDADVRSGLNLS